MDHSLEQLEAFASQFKTDKQAAENAYLALYLEYFERQGFKRDDRLRILEIGTNKGSSLRMWAEYFPNAHIVGFDITRQHEVDHILAHESISTYELDAGNREQLTKVLHNEYMGTTTSMFDIIIDDGSHEQSDQQTAWGYLFYHLNAGGLYIIEDIITGENWWDGRMYNRRKIISTRVLVQILEQTNRLTSAVMEPGEEMHIEESYDYCEYRESPTIVFVRHHPQLAFIGKK